MRTTIQTKLKELEPAILSGAFIPEVVIEVGTTYFGYEIQENFVSRNFSQADVKRISLIGFVTRKVVGSENTLAVVDSASQEIEKKLKELNFTVSLQDVSLQDEIRKVKITGVVQLDKFTNTLVF